MPSSRQQAEPPSSVPPHQRPHRLAGPAPDACTAGRPLLSSARSCPAWPGPPPCSVKILGPLSPASLLQACGYEPCHLARCPCTPGLHRGCSCPGHSGPPPWLPVHSRAPSLDFRALRGPPRTSGLGTGAPDGLPTPRGYSLSSHTRLTSKPWEGTAFPPGICHLAKGAQLFTYSSLPRETPGQTAWPLRGELPHPHRAVSAGSGPNSTPARHTSPREGPGRPDHSG